jgi:hypothetical protein
MCWKVNVTFRLTVSQSVSLGVEPHLGLMTRYLLLFDRLSRKMWEPRRLITLWACTACYRDGFTVYLTTGNFFNVLKTTNCSKKVLNHGVT